MICATTSPWRTSASSPASSSPSWRSSRGGGLVGLFLGGLLLAVIFARSCALGTKAYVQRKKAKRQAAFAEQLPDVLQLITTSLRSGYGITQALDSVAEEADEPARSEFAHVLTEARLGRDLSESLRAIAVRMDNVDLEWVVGAIDINRDTGGNLSETLGPGEHHGPGASASPSARQDTSPPKVDCRPAF